MSIFVQEVFLQERLLDICYNSHENFRYVLILKKETSLYVTKWISVMMKSLQRKYFIHKQAAWDQSWLKPFRRFHKNDVLLSKLHDYENNLQKDDRGLFQCPVFQINQDFPVQKQFLSFWRYNYDICYTGLKTRVATNAGAVRITFRCLATISWIKWIVEECINISVKVLDLYI